MKKKLAEEIAAVKAEIKKEIEESPEADGMLKVIFDAMDDKKVTFAKISFNGSRGPYVVAFENTLTRDYCEMNASDFKAISAADIKSEKVPLWECGAKEAEQINKLPKLDMKEFRERAMKEKLERKEARAEKMKATKAAKKLKPEPMGKVKVKHRKS